MQNKNNNRDTVSVLKEWASPTLLSILGMILWRDVNEMRSDIKTLLSQQSANQVKIEQLESEVKNLQSKVFTISTSQIPASEQSLPFVPGENSDTNRNKVYAVKEEKIKLPEPPKQS